VTPPTVYVGRGRLLTLTPWGAKLMTDADDLSITPDLALTGEYDPPFLRFLERVIQPGDVVVDVGANIGLFSMRMAWLTGPTGRVLAFEPAERPLELLTTNVAMNYASWVEVSPLALSDTPGSATLHVSSRFQGNSSLVPRNEWYRTHFPGDEGGQVNVQTATLDDVLETDAHVRLVKIDVEGAEASVLAGMRRILEDRRCDLIDVEVKRPVGEAPFQALLDRLRWLRDLGARFSEIAPDGSAVPITIEAVVARQALPHLVASFAT
jgi:FkbM family methyltransferase